MFLKLMYITNNLDIALIAEKYGVNRIWIDLETIGKEERQRGLDSVKSHHKISDIVKIKPHLSTAEMLVRINSWHEESVNEIDAVINAGADIIMLPYWKSVDEVKKFINAINGRCKATLLLETREAVECVDEVLTIPGFDEIHIGLNDLHLSYGLNFMFELLTNGTVEMLCKKFADANIPYGFGGIAKLGEGIIPAEKIIMEHYRLGSTRAILSRSFFNCITISDIEEAEKVFCDNMVRLIRYEKNVSNMTLKQFEKNRIDVIDSVNAIVDNKKMNGSLNVLG